MKRLAIILAIVLIPSLLLASIYVTETFTGADSSDIGVNFLPVPGRECHLRSNRVEPDIADNQCWEFYTGNALPATQSAQITIKVWTGAQVGNAGVFLRASQNGSGETSYYACFAQRGIPGGESGIFKLVNDQGGVVAINSSVTWLANDILACSISGTTLTLYRNGIQVFQATDTDNAVAGTTGLFVYDQTTPANTAIDDFVTLSPWFNLVPIIVR